MSSDPVTPFPRVKVYGHGGLGAPPNFPTMTPGGAGVLIRERGYTLQLHFAGPERDAPLLELRIAPDRGPQLNPANARQFAPLLDLYMAAARAALAWDEEDFRAAAKALRKVGTTGRGLSDDFYRLIAFHHKALVAEGEPYPVKALKGIHKVEMSTASRWVTEARRRGYLKAEKGGTRAR